MLNKNGKASSFFSPVILFLFDLIVLNAARIFVLLAEKNFVFSALNLKGTLFFLPVGAVVFCIFYLIGRIFRIAWDFSTMNDFLRMAFFAAASVFVTLILYEVLFPGEMSLVGYLCVLSAELLFCTGSRVLVRHYTVLNRAKLRRAALNRTGGGYDFGKTLIVGAGSGAQTFFREIENNAFFEKCYPVCLVDDNPLKKGFFVSGVQVEGDRHDIPALCKKYGIKTILLAIPSISGQNKREIVEICVKTGAEVRTMPSLSELLVQSSGAMQIKKVQIEDLLGRDPVDIDVEKVMGYVENKTVVVTGGGGSIGSELCRQIASHNPKRLVIFDIYENNAYDILNEIRRNRPDVNVEAYIGSVRDSERLEQLFLSVSPDIVYHAAAHKHVPLMEDSPNEAVKNNVFGTLNAVRAADRAKVKRFVLISTDKAVNPTNVMGATKRMCEMIVQSYNKKSDTEFVAVRFGNVLGSNGSVIPLFERKIANGGPVTVTHPDIIRYFMTIPEAVSLVLQAGATASGGEIFVLDMGKPVKIDDLARNMIRLSGFEPDVDIEVKYTGLRPGEKLFEELLMDEEGLRETDNKLIHIGRPIEFDEEEFFKGIEELKSVMYDDTVDVRAYISKLVPTFITPEKANAGYTGAK